jgi:hypothetical protein
VLQVNLARLAEVGLLSRDQDMNELRSVFALIGDEAGRSLIAVTVNSGSASHLFS